jgi:hypothetical protein
MSGYLIEHAKVRILMVTQLLVGACNHQHQPRILLLNLMPHAPLLGKSYMPQNITHWPSTS